VTEPTHRVGVVHFGLGPIGRAAATIVAAHPALEAVAAVDSDPALAGTSLGALLEERTSGRPVEIAGSLGDASLEGAKVALHCTGSSLERVLPQIISLIDAGLCVVSTCEELSFPWSTGARAATIIHERAAARGVAVLATGVNPGFAMDYLPVVLAGITQRVDGVRVVRVADAGKRRVPLQRKVGVGLTVEEFNERVRARQLGHVGLRQSADALASAFGWQIDGYDEVIDPVVATRQMMSSLGPISSGAVVGLHQVARSTSAGETRVELDLTLAITDAAEADIVILRGDPSVEMRIPGGLHGDSATAAIVVNAIPQVLGAEPGLLTMADIAPPHPWSALRPQA